MHIPAAMLHGTICPITAGLSGLAVGAASLMAVRSAEKPTASRFGAVSAVVFAAQMVNFPVQHGTSGHLLGGVLVSTLLGLPFGILSLCLVLLIQCAVFSDGGFSALGANVFNMAVAAPIAGAVIYGVFRSKISANRFYKIAVSAVAAWFSVMAAAFFCSLELAASGAVSLSKIVPAMLSVHARIGVGEGILTVLLLGLLSCEENQPAHLPKKTGASFLTALLIPIIAGVWGSASPDGLERVLEKYAVLHSQAPRFTGWLTGYSLPLISSPGFSTAAAGTLGVLAIFFAAWSLNKILQLKSAKADFSSIRKNP